MNFATAEADSIIFIFGQYEIKVKSYEDFNDLQKFIDALKNSLLPEDKVIFSDEGRYSYAQVHYGITGTELVGQRILYENICWESDFCFYLSQCLRRGDYRVCDLVDLIEKLTEFFDQFEDYAMWKAYNTLERDDSSNRMPKIEATVYTEEEMMNKTFDKFLSNVEDSDLIRVSFKNAFDVISFLEATFDNDENIHFDGKYYTFAVID